MALPVQEPLRLVGDTAFHGGCIHLTCAGCSSYIKEFIESVLPLITSLVNSSLSSGVFPDVFKHALVKLLPKKKQFDSEVMKNYRPVSNIAFIGKLIENVAAKSLTHCLKQNNLLEKMQSAYRSYHSTESALL